MVCFSRNIEQRKQIYSYEANGLGVVSCSYNERTNHLRIYRRLLTNRLHGKQLNYVWLTAEITA